MSLVKIQGQTWPHTVYMKCICTSLFPDRGTASSGLLFVCVTWLSLRVSLTSTSLLCGSFNESSSQSLRNVKPPSRCDSLLYTFACRSWKAMECSAPLPSSPLPPLSV